jgi:hypothetical protein
MLKERAKPTTAGRRLDARDIEHILYFRDAARVIEV